MQYFFIGCAFWGTVAFIIYSLRPKGVLSSRSVLSANRTDKYTAALVMSAVILLCILPMSLSPSWNGDIPMHRNQYEVLAESFLDGRLDLDYGDMDPGLLEMDNPYDPEARKEAGVHYHWDHALYNGKYYMYFGVVPVLILFLPFRWLTGSNLTTYHATQIFTAFIIWGIFSLFSLISRKILRRVNLAVYLSLSAAVSIMSVWYFSSAPALYCTAISAGVCMQIWSLYFYMRAVWDSNEGKQCVRFSIVGSILGALTFGCRPTVALINFFTAPLFLYCLKKRRELNWPQITAVFSPFIVIGVLLMLYNYARFDNPFEFGQSYQLTVADQTGYKDSPSQLDVISLVNGVLTGFIWYAPMWDSFPFLPHESILLNFPICIIAILFILQKDSLRKLIENRLSVLVCVLILSMIVITAVQITQSPTLLERYRSDLYWIAGIVVFISFGTFLETLQDRHVRIFGFIFSLLALNTAFRSFLLWCLPYDNSFTSYYPEYLDKFARVLSLGI